MALRSTLLLLSLGIALASSAGCSDDPGSDTTGTGGGSTTTTGAGGAGGTGGGGVTPACTMPTEVACSDQVILQMNLQSDITPGEVASEADGAGFLSTIDATAGGAFASDPDSYTYARFTDAGLEKVAISDEDSLDSMDWDIAFRRYVVRINSGNSGPSCVRAARVPGAAKYDELSAAPDNLAFHTDSYFTDSCEIIPDGSGLPDSPATALSSYWSYPGCVAMTDNVFVLALGSGRQVKLTVASYYKPEVQDECDTKGSVPMMGSGSANFRVRWAFLP